MCNFEEEDGLVVLDYKTDRVRTADETCSEIPVTAYILCPRPVTDYRKGSQRKDHLFICSWKGNQRLNGSYVLIYLLAANVAAFLVFGIDKWKQ